jgi:uncharacterized repeat protein (TIGR01451 family)
MFIACWCTIMGKHIQIRDRQAMPMLRLIIIAFAGILISSTVFAGNDNIIWENQGLASGASIPSGATLIDSNNRVGATLTRSAVVVGGTFTSNFSFNAATLGNHVGYGRFDINNSNNDPNDRFRVTITFNEPVTNLQFSLLDIDLRNGTGTSDAVEIYYNGNINAGGSAFVTSIGSSTARDNETYMDGYEGIASSAANQTTGNVNLNFGSTSITSITIVFFTSDDSNLNPNPQFMGISDLTYDVTADLVVTKTNSVTSLLAGAITTYVITVTNNGPNSAGGARLTDSALAGLQLLDPIACSAAGGAACPALIDREVSDITSAAGIIIPTLPSGGSVTFTVNANVTASGF